MKKLFVYLIALAVMLPTAMVADNKTPQKPPKITRPTTKPTDKPKPKPTQKTSSKPKPTQKPADNKQNEEMERLRRENEELRRQQEQQAEAERKRRQQEAQRRQQEQQASQQLSNKRFTVGGVSFTMVGIQGGTFQMGSTTGDSDEKPVHSVTLSSYYIGQTEVTQALWKAVMGSNPSRFKGDNLPVEQVSWNDCQTFISKLNSLTGERFRLPTEAEWEFAARAGSRTSLYNGQDIVINGKNNSPNLDPLAWYGGNCGRNYTASEGCDVANGYDISSWSEKQYSDSKGGTHPVGRKQPNAYGLYDMLGNVLEWCQDWYGDYSSSYQTNPTGPSSGSYRVFRGGSWSYDATFCRTADRFNDSPSNSLNRLGLRLALSE